MYGNRLTPHPRNIIIQSVLTLLDSGPDSDEIRENFNSIIAKEPTLTWWLGRKKAWKEISYNIYSPVFWRKIRGGPDEQITDLQIAADLIVVRCRPHMSPAIKNTVFRIVCKWDEKELFSFPIECWTADLCKRGLRHQSFPY